MHSYQADHDTYFILLQWYQQVKVNWEWHLTWANIEGKKTWSVVYVYIGGWGTMHYYTFSSFEVNYQNGSDGQLLCIGMMWVHEASIDGHVAGLICVWRAQVSMDSSTKTCHYSSLESHQRCLINLLDYNLSQLCCSSLVN